MNTRKMFISSIIVKLSVSGLLWFFHKWTKPLYISSLLNSRIEKPTAKAICLDISGGVEETAIVFSSRIILPRKFLLRHLADAFFDLHIISTSTFLLASCIDFPNRTLLKNFHMDFSILEWDWWRFKVVSCTKSCANVDWSKLIISLTFSNFKPCLR